MIKLLQPSNERLTMNRYIIILMFYKCSTAFLHDFCNENYLPVDASPQNIMNICTQRVFANIVWKIHVRSPSLRRTVSSAAIWTRFSLFIWTKVPSAVEHGRHSSWCARGVSLSDSLSLWNGWNGAWMVPNCVACTPDSSNSACALVSQTSKV